MSLFIVRPKTRLKLEKRNDPAGITLISDLHIGAHNVNYDAIYADLKDAADNGDRILINGDVLDLILPSDSKRYSPDALHPRLHGRRDVLSAGVEMAAEILSPYANQIDMIGLGNHEDAVTKYHSVDPIMMLIDKLRVDCKDGHEIAYGGYTGFVDYRISFPGTGGKRMVIYYHHGSGGASPVTKGIIDFDRKASWVDSDVVWLGHKHNRISDSTPQRMRCPMEGDAPVFDQQVMVMTGGYMSTYYGQSQEDVLKNGRKTSYAAAWGLAPQSPGGSRLLISCHGREKKVRIRVLQ